MSDWLLDLSSHSQLSGILCGVRFSFSSIDLGIVSAQRGERDKFGGITSSSISDIPRRRIGIERSFTG
ncbi:MAG: hypothetical protein ACYDC3_11380 [Candidatus Binataceae bacterium]